MIQHYKIPITTYVRERVQSYNISIQAYEYDTTLQDSYYVRETVQSYNISTRI